MRQGEIHSWVDTLVVISGIGIIGMLLVVVVVVVGSLVIDILRGRP